MRIMGALPLFPYPPYAVGINDAQDSETLGEQVRQTSEGSFLALHSPTLLQQYST